MAANAEFFAVSPQSLSAGLTESGMVQVVLAAALVASVVAVPNGKILGRAENSTTLAPGASSTSAQVSTSSTSASIISTSIAATTPASTTTTSLFGATSILSSAVPSNATAPSTPVPTGALPDDYFIKGNTPRTWSQALALAAKFIAPMSIEEKTALATGVAFGSSRCVGNIIDQPKYKFPGLCLQDSPLGVRLTDRVSAFTAGINAAATWDRELIRARGKALGEEFRGKGVNVALGPAMNLARVAAGGRNWEGFGADPYLSGEAAYETIVGIQSTGVQACAKHYINNEQEIKRDASSSDVDDRTQHEMYAHPFLRSVAAGVASFMCSYNQVNGTYLCENDKLLNGILKNEYGFPGYVMSDWGIREMGAASTILLKNSKGALPLKKPVSLAAIGSDAAPPLRGPNGFTDRAGVDGTLAMAWGSGTAEFPYLISPLEALEARAKQDHTSISWHTLDWDTAGAKTRAANKDVAIVFINSDSGEGYLTVDGNRGDRNNLTAWNNGDKLVQEVASVNSNTVVVVHSVGPIIMEPWIDNPNVTAAKNQETHWLMFCMAQLTHRPNSLTPSLNNDLTMEPTFYMTIVLNPSAKLPYTIAKQRSDYGTDVLYDNSDGIPHIPYSEGLFVDYRHFDKNNITPRFDFGFGLSYTTFGYANLRVSKSTKASTGSEALGWEAGRVAPNLKGASLAPWLHAPYYEVSFDINNTGQVAGNEVAQLYIQAPTSANSPPNQLRGFTRVALKAGQTKRVTLTLSRYDLSVWDVTRQGWVKMNGQVRVAVGASSRDFRLKGAFA
ncbi:hypothetical protein RSAG8_11172, partial [Rhizoctonia solani AG-8 WAC10335]